MLLQVVASWRMMLRATGAIWRRLVHDGAGWRTLGQGGARSCRMVQAAAARSNGQAAAGCCSMVWEAGACSSSSCSAVGGRRCVVVLLTATYASSVQLAIMHTQEVEEPIDQVATASNT